MRVELVFSNRWTNKKGRDEFSLFFRKYMSYFLNMS